MDEKFGEKLRAARLASKMPLKDLSARCGLSYSYISQVERGEANPSLSSLKRLAEALGMSVWELLRDNSGSEPQNTGRGSPDFANVAPRVQSRPLEPVRCITKVVRKNGRRSVILPRSDVRYQMITPDLNGQLQLLIVEAEPGTNSGDQPLEHMGEECCFILSGKVEIDVGSETFVLEKDESIYFSSDLRHSWRNIGEDKLILLLAVTPPAY